MMQLRNIMLLMFVLAVVWGDANIPTRDDFDDLSDMINDQRDLVDKQATIVRFLRDEIFPRIDTSDRAIKFRALLASVDKQRDLLDDEADFVDHLRDNIFPIREETEVEPPSSGMARDCKELLDRGFTEDNVYTIQAGSEAIEVYCNMTMGGWIVFQRRFDGSVNFRRDFETYSKGFGNYKTEFWIGLKQLHQITKKGNWELRVDFESYWEYPRKSYAEYNNFRIGDSPLFTFNLDISLESYSGTAGNGFWDTNGAAFSTFDKDQDKDPTSSCSKTEGGSGGWWYTASCGVTVCNGMPFMKHEAIRWWMGELNFKFYKTSEFKIRLIDSNTDS